MNKVKTIATITKDNNQKEDLLSFIDKGISIFRIDLSVMNHADVLNVTSTIQEINKDLSSKIAIMLDTKGPILKTEKFLGGKATFKRNDKIRIYSGHLVGDKTKIYIDYKDLVDDINYDSKIKIDGGMVELKVIDKSDKGDSLICQVIKGGEVSNHSNVNISDCKLKLKFLNKKNKEDIILASKILADYLVLSYISSIDDVLDVNDMLIEQGNDHTAIISKIENEQALEEIDEILSISDGLIVARKNLSSEIPLERIPGIQKRIINKCNLAGKTSIVSTDVFDGSIDVPTRSEVSDIANAVLDGTDAIILGNNPTYDDNSIEVLDFINKIVENAENDIEHAEFYDKSSRSEEKDIAGSIVSSVVSIANKLRCAAIIIPTNSAIIAKRISRFRPICPIVVLTNDEEVLKNMSANYGIYPILVDKINSINNVIKDYRKIIENTVHLSKGDKVIITSAYPINSLNNPNLIEIEEI